MTEANRSTERKLTDAMLDGILANGTLSPFWDFSNLYQAVKELRANRRGEFICSRCYLRKDGEKPNVDF